MCLPLLTEQHRLKWGERERGRCATKCREGIEPATFAGGDKLLYMKHFLHIKCRTFTYNEICLETGAASFLEQMIWNHLWPNPPWPGWSKSLLTCGGDGNDVTPVAGATDVDRSHRDEVTVSCLQLDQTLTGGHRHYRPAGLNKTGGWHHFLFKHLKCTIMRRFQTWFHS